MLTVNEKRWLHDRLNGCFFAYCRPWCPQFDACKSHTQKCPTRENIKSIKDAAAFEQRVATKLATILDRTLRSRDYTLHADCTRVCPAATDCTKNNRLGFNCAPYLMKWARLAVEEEMDGYNDA